MGIFKAYDIRGIYPEEINEAAIYKIGKVFSEIFNAKNILVGRDMRTSSNSLVKALINGLTDSGAVVTNAGLVDTPMFYFCAKDYEAGLMVTASHNPKQYNGLKIVGKGLKPISYEGGLNIIEEKIGKLEINEEECLKNAAKQTSKDVVVKDFMPKFIAFNLGFSDGIKKMKIVIDAANGMGGLTFPAVFKKIKNLDFECMYENPDGNFPNHEANPLKEENLKDLKKEVVNKKADIGIAPDGDADRVIFIDETGRSVGADLAAALIAQNILEEHPGSTILYDLRSSNIVKEIVESKGGKALMCRVGHSYIKGQMRKDNAIFAGEVSGHLYFRENTYAESSIIASLAIMKLMSKTGKKLSELIAPLRKYYQSGEINFQVKDKDAKMEELEKIFYDGKTSHLDGIRIDFDDFWFNARASNTEPVLRLNLEAKTEAKMLDMKNRISKIITN